MTARLIDEPTLRRVWDRNPGLPGWLTAVNHKIVGLRFIVTSFVFLLIGGLLALAARTQLAVPDNSFLSGEAYNQVFTLHGATMMFLFAVPMVEGLAIYLVPTMIGTRDLPFPRLNAFGYWCYLFGGLILYTGFALGSAPDTGWFAYVPLSGPEFSQGLNLDFFLIGVTFVEVGGIIGAIEIIVAILWQRAPGMTLSRMPVFVWASLVMAGMMLFAFPPLIAGTLMLEFDRKLGFQIFEAGAGGDPLLWQHLFWIFGHPEVYLLLIPAVGIISMIVSTFTRRRIVAYRWVVASLVAIGVLSFGLWAHHMFTTGLSMMILSFFAAASFIIAIPSGVLIFSWLATMMVGRPRFEPPMLFLFGFVVIFVLGGITGVMVAAAPFDWQAHDTFFVVAHFHYVLIGGVVFPIFAGLYYYFPKWTGRLPHPGAGRWSFWLMFIGFNVAFFVQHYLGLIGMPRRIYTYPVGLGWEVHNMISTVGSFILALGVLVFTLNLGRSLRYGPPAGENPWDAGTLEWATESPPAPYGFERIPVVASSEPLWEPADRVDPDLARALDRLDDPDHPRRRVAITSATDAELEGAMTLPTDSWWPLIVAGSLAVALVGALYDNGVVAASSILVTLGGTLAWAWEAETEETP